MSVAAKDRPFVRRRDLLMYDKRSFTGRTRCGMWYGSVACRGGSFVRRRDLLMYGERFYGPYALWYMVWYMVGYMVGYMLGYMGVGRHMVC